MQSRKLIGIAIGIALAGLAWGQQGKDLDQAKSNAAALRDAGNYGQARAAYAAIAKHKDTPANDKASAHRMIGLMFQREGNLDQAIAAYRDAISVEGQANPYHSKRCLADALQVQSRTDKSKLADAIAAYRDAEGAAQNPDTAAGVRLVLADMLAQAGQTDESTAILDTVAKDDAVGPAVRALAYTQRALSRSAAGNIPAALADLDAAIALDSPYRPRAQLCAAGLLRLSDPARAAAYGLAALSDPAITAGQAIRALAFAKPAADPAALSKAAMAYVLAKIRSDGCAPASAVALAIDAIDPRAVTTEDYVAYLDEALRVAQTATQNVEYLTKLKNELNRLK